MENILLDALLFDFYGGLLTQKQRDIYEMYYSANLSLTEISAETGITPQAARDILERTRRNLRKYEDAVGAVKRHGELAALRQKLADALSRSNGVSGELAAVLDDLSAILDT